MQYGYCRVSTELESLEPQMKALRAVGCVDAKIFAEKADGAATDLRKRRPVLAKAIATLTEGDIIVVTALNRLARSTRDLLAILDGECRIGSTTLVAMKSIVR